MTQDIDLKGLDVPGYVKFTIKADDNIENNTIHEAFKEMARVECGNDYTLAIRKLLEYYERDAKFDSLYHLIVELDQRITVIEQSLLDEPEESEDDEGAF